VKAEGADTGFFLMGGPSNDAIGACIASGIRMIDVRHEQAAAMMANAYARVRARPAFCIAASGPGTINLTTGLAHALIDCAPVVAFGGASPIGGYATGAFQEIDQVAIMAPVTKHAERVHDARRIPEYVARAFRTARSGKPGPVYLDLPGDVLYTDVDEAKVMRPLPALEPHRPLADAASIGRLLQLLKGAERPVLVTGSASSMPRAFPSIRRRKGAASCPRTTTASTARRAPWPFARRTSCWLSVRGSTTWFPMRRPRASPPPPSWCASTSTQRRSTLRCAFRSALSPMRGPRWTS
jgi:acetolactate synthase-1/2/3 large subunit